MKAQEGMMGANGGRSMPPRMRAQNAPLRPRSVQILETQWACDGSLRTVRWLVSTEAGPNRNIGR